MKKFTALIMTMAVLLCCYGTCFSAAAEAFSAQPAPEYNLNSYLVKYSYLRTAKDGYMRVYTPRGDGENGNIEIEYYDKSFCLTEKISIPRELEYWGGFFEGAEYYFTVEGTSNKDEIDTNEIIRVNKYDKNWNKLGTANITGDSSMFGGEVRYPFDYGCCEMTELNGVLYIATGHQGYVDPSVNQGHQGLLLLMVDENEMTGQIADCDLWHSFAQYIENDGTNLYLFENSEGSRRSQLTQYDPSALPADYFDDQVTLPILKYGGERTSSRAVATYASCDGIALSENNILCLGTSIDQTKYGEDYTYNIYLSVTPKDNVSEDTTTVKWITNLVGDGESYSDGVNCVYLTKINENRFMISWNQTENVSALTDYNDPLSSQVLHYIFVDGDGNTLSEEFTANAAFSECKPIYDGTQIVFYASNDTILDFYTIDALSGELEKTVYRVLGDDITWYYEDGVLTVSGTGEMNTLGSDESPEWPSELRKAVTKIVIEGSIKSISDFAFTYFENAEEIVIEDGVESIGTEAFYSCSSLDKITIPASVTNIGDDIIWTGYFWVSDHSHVYDATIYTEEGSAADAYAKNCNIRCAYYSTIRDAVVLQKYLLNVDMITKTQFEQYDYNKDGIVNGMDLAVLRQELINKA